MQSNRHREPNRPRVLLRPGAAAKALGIATRTLRKYTARGILPVYRLGAVRIYDLDELLEVMRPGPNDQCQRDSETGTD